MGDVICIGSCYVFRAGPLPLRQTAIKCPFCGRLVVGELDWSALDSPVYRLKTHEPLSDAVTAPIVGDAASVLGQVCEAADGASARPGEVIDGA